jgi:superfamily II DNA/RNA helicase
VPAHPLPFRAFAEREHFEQLEEQKDVQVVVAASGYEGVLSSSSFSELPLPEALQRGIENVGWKRPSPIQAQALPFLLRPDRPSLLGQSKNGTGKTGAFGLAMLGNIDPGVLAPQALCLAPTRLLAIQTAKQLQRLTGFMPELVIKVLVGGTGSYITEPIKAHVLVGTDGRVADLLKRRLIDPRGMKIFVIDEADEMITQQRAPSVVAIKRFLPQNVQTLLFSASFECLDPAARGADEAKRLVELLLDRKDGRRYIEIRVKSRDELRSENVTHFSANVSAGARRQGSMAPYLYLIHRLPHFFLLSHYSSRPLARRAFPPP